MLVNPCDKYNGISEPVNLTFEVIGPGTKHMGIMNYIL